MDILIIDFCDSFTFNIAEEVYKFTQSISVINYQNLSLSHLAQEQKQVVILGPGPGHPAEYLPRLQEFMALARVRENIFVMGICLGHQLLMSAAGLEVRSARAPIHGEARSFTDFKGEKFAVQFYNSLACYGETEQYSLLKNEYGEILAARRQREVSYQFHPESVGTSYPSKFFEPVRNFLYD